MVLTVDWCGGDSVTLCGIESAGSPSQSRLRRASTLWYDYSRQSPSFTIAPLLLWGEPLYRVPPPSEKASPFGRGLDSPEGGIYQKTAPYGAAFIV